MSESRHWWESLGGVFGGLGGLLVIPGIGWVILGLLITLIVLSLGVSVWAFLWLQSIGAFTALVFGALTAALFWTAKRSGALTLETQRRYPLLWLAIPSMAGLGYIADRAGAVKLTLVSSLSTGGAAPSQIGLTVILFVLCVLSAIYLAITLASAKPKPKRTSSRSRKQRRKY